MFTAEDRDKAQTVASVTITVKAIRPSFDFKAETAAKIEFLVSVDVGDADLSHALGYIYLSLGDNASANAASGFGGSEVVWGDSLHVDTCNGGFKGADVFQYGQQACDKLDAYDSNPTNDGFGFGADIEFLRQRLAIADRMLAQQAIDDALAAGGVAGDIALAEQLLADGDTATAAGGSEICDIALDRYEEAWEKAVRSHCLTE